MADTQALAQAAYLIASTQVRRPSYQDYQNSGVNTGEGGVSYHSYVQSLIVEKACDLIAQARMPDPESKGFPYIMDNLLVMLGQTTAKDASLKTFVTTIENVELDQKSNRVVVHFHGPPTQKNADGREKAYTDRIDGYQAHGLLVANRAQALIGHKVRVTVQIEVMANKGGNKARTIKHLQDMGQAKPEDFQPRQNNGGGQPQQAQPQQGGFGGQGGF